MGDVVQLFAARAGQHYLPWGMHLIASFLGLTKTAMVKRVPGGASSLAVVA